MADNITLPGKYHVNNIQLFSNVGSIDVRNLFLELNIFEDIFSNSITGNIVLSDSNNLISGSNALPILGNEIIYINIDVPNIYQDSSSGNDISVNITRIKFFGRVTSIREKRLITEKNQAYIIDFIAEEAITSNKIRVSKSYKAKSYSTIAQTIFKELGSSTKSSFEETKYSYNFICPNWHPFKAINWLASRSLSTKYEGSSFVFYHKLYDPSTQSAASKTTDMFLFRSIESMLDGKIKKRVFFYPKNLEPYNYPTDATRFSNIDSYDVVKSFDIMENLDSGLYSSKLILHDLINKRYTNTVFNYDSQFSKFKHAESGKILSAIPDSFGYRFPAYQDSVLRLYSDDKSMVTSNHISEVIGSRLSILNSLNNYAIKFSIPGDGFSSPGDIIYFEIPSPEVKLTMDTFYSGKLLVTSIRHHFSTEYYNMVFECVKESLKIDPQNYTPVDGVIGNS